MSKSIMIPTDMLDLRNKVEEALKGIGFKMSGAGVSLVEPEADLSGSLGGQEVWIIIKVRGISYLASHERAGDG